MNYFSVKYSSLKQSSLLKTSVLAVGTLLSTISLAADEAPADDENRLIVTAEFEQTELLQVPASVSIVDAEQIEREQAHSLDEILSLAPNVNTASGASRGRFIQIRGIGERSEFVEPVNYSVGVVVDGIDMTGIAMGATLLDVEQVEILRGPQGTLYGANALAGLINVVSHQSTDRFEGQASVGFAEYGGQDYSAVVSGPLSADLGYRIALGQVKSDGFIVNDTLNRDDTNNIDETTLRARFDYDGGEAFTLSTHLLWLDIDNGYDAFSLDNTRHTLSDNPGRDQQQTTALSFDSEWGLSDTSSFQLLASHAKSELSYGYDEDWTWPGICDGTPCDSSLFGFDWWYASTDRYDRDNQNTSLDFRFKGKNEQADWVMGVYYRDQSVDLYREYTWLSGPFRSQFDTQNLALYGQYQYQLSQAVRLESGLRFEQRDADYADSDGATFSPEENLWGGKLAISWQLDNQQQVYGLISRGYKAGGFNAEGSLSASDRLFDTEFMWNYELGLKGRYLENKLLLQASLFFQDRKDVQTKQSIVRSIADGRLLSEGGVCPCSFTDLIKNAAASQSRGLEFEAHYQLTDDFKIYANLGLLDSPFKNFQSFTHVLADPENGIAYNLDGRDQAYAPRHQSVLGIEYWLSQHWQLQTNVQSKGSFYFSDRHNVKSEAYDLFNLSVTYVAPNWKLTLYGRNLTDETVQTRAFGSFGNDPRKFYEVEPYYQLGAPRLVGVKAAFEF